MPHRDQFFEDLANKNRQAALLVTQVGGMPQELQIITQVAEYDEAAQGLRPIRTYIIRVLGVLEHRIVNLGTTVDEIKLESDHPLLYQYTAKPTALFFRGEVANTDSITIDMLQAYASTFGPWRQFPEYMNTDQPLENLLKSGGGLLGQMPEPLAVRLQKVLEHHKLETKITQGTPYVDEHKNPMQEQQLSVLVFGASYFVAYAFSFDVMKGRKGDS